MKPGGYVILTAVVFCKSDEDFERVTMPEIPGLTACYDKSVFRGSGRDRCVVFEENIEKTMERIGGIFSRAFKDEGLFDASDAN